MKTNKSIAGLLAEWTFGPLPTFGQRRTWSHTDYQSPITDYQPSITDYLSTGYESPINKLPITCHQLSKSPANSTEVQPGPAKG
jgi:hypothetical protein